MPWCRHVFGLLFTCLLVSFSPSLLSHRCTEPMLASQNPSLAAISASTPPRVETLMLYRGEGAHQHDRGPVVAQVVGRHARLGCL